MPVVLQMRKITYHIVLWLVALSVLNSSIDVVESFTPPLQKTTAAKETGMQSNDEIESIVELVMDEATNHEQRLPDNKDNEQKSTLKKPVAFDFSLPVKKEKLLSPFINNSDSNLQAASNAASLSSGYTTISTPPPDKSPLS